MTKHGKLYPPETMFFRNAVGSAEGQDGKRYEMTTNVGTGQPIIHSE